MKKLTPVQTSIPGCDEIKAAVAAGCCIACGRPRENNEPFFRLFFFMQTVGVKPRSKSKSEAALVCPRCVKRIPAAPLEKMFTDVASKPTKPLARKK